MEQSKDSEIYSKTPGGPGEGPDCNYDISKARMTEFVSSMAMKYGMADPDFGQNYFHEAAKWVAMATVYEETTYVFFEIFSSSLAKKKSVQIRHFFYL